MQITMAQCKTAVSPLLTHWRYCSHAPSHWYIFFVSHNKHRTQSLCYLWSYLPVPAALQPSLDRGQVNGILNRHGVHWEGTQVHWSQESLCTRLLHQLLQAVNNTLALRLSPARWPLTLPWMVQEGFQFTICDGNGAGRLCWTCHRRTNYCTFTGIIVTKVYFTTNWIFSPQYFNGCNIRSFLILELLVLILE